MHHRPRIIIVILHFLLLNLHLVLHNRLVFSRRRPPTTEPNRARAADAPAALRGPRSPVSGGVEGVDNLAQVDVELVQGVAARGVGQQLGVDRVADDGVDVPRDGLGRGGGDVELAEEGGDDFLFFFCLLVSKLACRLCGQGKGKSYSARSHPTSQSHPSQTPDAHQR